MRKIFSFAAPLLLALSLTACGSDAPSVVDSDTGEAVPAETANKSGKPPTVELDPASIQTDEDYGFKSYNVKEIHVKLESGKTVVCLLNTRYNTIDTCDWDHPLADPTEPR